jgi:hypothetical protein
VLEVAAEKRAKWKRDRSLSDNATAKVLRQTAVGTSKKALADQGYEAGRCPRPTSPFPFACELAVTAEETTQLREIQKVLTALMPVDEQQATATNTGDGGIRTGLRCSSK